MSNQINDYDYQNPALSDDSFLLQTAAGVTKRVAAAALYDAFGQIGFSGTGTDHNPTTTPEKITDFDTSIISLGVTTQPDKDELDIVTPGSYDISLKVHATVSDSESYTIYIAKNNVEIGSMGLDIERQINELDINDGGLTTGLVNGDVLTVWVSSGNAGGAEFIPTRLQLKINRVGF